MIFGKEEAGEASSWGELLVGPLKEWRFPVVVFFDLAVGRVGAPAVLY